MNKTLEELGYTRTIVSDEYIGYYKTGKYIMFNLLNKTCNIEQDVSRNELIAVGIKMQEFGW